MKSLDISYIKLDINDKLNNVNDKLVTIKSGFKENEDNLVKISLRVTTESLHEENSLLHQKIEKLESQISFSKTDLNKQDQ